MLGLSFRRLFVVFCVIIFAGCMGTPRITDPARTAVEQLLLSTSAERAIEGIDLRGLAGKKVFLDSTGFKGIDKAYAIDRAYAIGVVSILLGKHGALIVEDKQEAEIIAAITSGALSIDRTDKLLGLPSFGVPIPLTGIIQTPELAFFKTIKQKGTAKFAINIYEKQTGRHLFAVGPKSGNTYYNYHTVFIFFTFRTTDIPEKKKGWWN